MVVTIAGIGYGLFTMGASKAGIKTKKKKAFKPTATAEKVDDWDVKAYVESNKPRAVGARASRAGKPNSKKD
jgi:hypothetical protein